MRIDLRQGDCLELMKDIPDKSIDLVVIDPPYDFMSKHYGKSYSRDGAFGSLGRKYHKELESNDIITGINENVLQELIRVMKKVNIYIWCSKEQILKYFSSSSIPIKFRFKFLQATPVVPEPIKQSNTTSFSFELLIIRFSIISTGLIVGCLYDFLSSLLVGVT